MEQDQKIQTAQANPPSSMPSEASTAAAPMDNGGQSASLESLMAQSPKLCPLSGWLTCLRKPALSMQYSLQKRHVPDLDADAGCQGQADNAQSSGGGQTGQTKPRAQSQPASPSAQKGKNSDTMGLTGGFTIRYFDLAMGVLGLTLLGCMMKGCMCLKRHLR